MSNVYAITHPHGYAKIGKSDTPIKRFNGIRGSCPYQVELFAVLSTDGNALELETEIHKEVEETNVHGEWFELSKSQVYRLFREIADNNDDVYHLERVEYKRGNGLRETATPKAEFSTASEL